MYCPNCGKPVQGETHFCPNRGASMNAAPSVDRTLQAAEQPVEKSGCSNVIVLVLVALGIFMLIRYILAPELFGEDSSTVSSTVSAVSSEDKTQNSNREEYNRVFRDRHIVHLSEIFRNMDSAAFAIADEETGIVHCMEFGYSGDIVLAMTETAYFSMEGYTEEERSQKEQEIRASYEEYGESDFCTVTFDSTYSYYVVQMKYIDMDKPENCRQLAEWGMLDKGSSFVSISKSEEDLLSQGYVKE